jgi:hypothetical protein
LIFIKVALAARCDILSQAIAILGTGDTATAAVRQTFTMHGTGGQYD